jgi:hypothetical protein
MGQAERVGWRVTRLWRDDKGRDFATTHDFPDAKDAWVAYFAECKWPGQVDLYDVSKGEVIASNSWPEGWSPYQHHEQRRFTSDG